jgi:serine/threonine protein kinase
LGVIVSQLKKPIVFESAFARYVASENIGEGGTGTVYKAADEKQQTVAIKVLDASKASSRVRRSRFKNELLFGERNQHPNVITVIDHGLHSVAGTTTPFYVMPFYPSSLRQQMLDGIAAVDVLPLFAQCLDGVEAAHLQGIVHRDLKPENVLFDKSARRLVIADFGVAEFAEDELYTLVETKPNTRLANFQYAAPEQRERGGTCDRRTDIFALGLILNEMFTKVVPHGTGYPTIAAIAPDFAYVDELVAWMLRQRLSDRPASVEIIKNELGGRRNVFVERQELDRLKRTVVRVSEVTDPILEDPIRVIGRDWDRNVLTLKLSQPVNADWTQALQYGAYSKSSLLGKGPENVRLSGDTATVQARADEAQQVIDYFKSWLGPAHQIYAQQRERETKDRVRRQREAVEQEIKQRSEREQLLGRLRI